MEAQHAYEKSTQTFMSRAATRGSQSKAIRQVFLAHPYAMISLQTSNEIIFRFLYIFHLK